MTAAEYRNIFGLMANLLDFNDPHFPKSSSQMALNPETSNRL